jgi:ABC-2 type transport system permease protein
MLHLLKVEWLKLKHYRTFWILSALYVISNYGISYIAYLIQLDVSREVGKNPVAKALIGNPPFSFPEIWHTVTYMCGFLLFIPGLLIIISVTNEFSFKTHRQNIVDGWSRLQFISVKLALVVIASIISTILVFITAWTFGLWYGSAVSFDKIEYVGYFFIQALSFCSIAMVFALLLKRSGLAIGVYFLYVVVLENLVRGLVSNYIDEKSGHYLPLNSTYSLIPFPFLRRVTNNFLYKPDYNILLPLALAYLVLYFVFCVRRYKTDDL